MDEKERRHPIMISFDGAPETGELRMIYCFKGTVKELIERLKEERYLN